MTASTEKPVVTVKPFTPAAGAGASGTATPLPGFVGWELESDEFIVEVVLAGKDILGLDVDWADGKTLYIKGIKLGVIKDWNNAHKFEAVQPGDRVIAINGVADDPDAMLGQCRNRGKLKLLIRGQENRTTLRKKAELAAKEAELAKASLGGKREAPKAEETSLALPEIGPEETLVTIETNGVALGLDVDWCDGKSLYIRAILTGAISAWNDGRAGDEAIAPGDTITAVNGVAKDPQAMLHQFKTQRRLQLRIRGPPQPPPLHLRPEGRAASPSPVKEKEKKKRKK